MQIDTAKVELATAQEIVRLSELYLDGTVQFAIAADNRAFALSAMLAAAVTALSGGGLAVLTAAKASCLDVTLGCAALAAAVGLFSGLWNALQSGRPENFYVSGNRLSEWRNEADLYGPLAAALIGQAEIYQEQIRENREALEKSSRYFERAMKSLIWAPAFALGAGMAAYLIATFCGMII